MNRTGLAAVLAAWVLISGAAALGQGQVEASPAERAPTEAESAATDAAPSPSEGARSAGDAIPSPTVGARSAGDAATSPPAVAGSAGDSDPFDYEASEQISEDLSVSFPVDI